MPFRLDLRKIAAALLLAACLLVAFPLSGCTQLGLTDPSRIEGVQPGEVNKLRVVQAALVVKGSYQAIDTQLTRGIITPAEARKAKDAVDSAAKAVDIAAEAVKLENASAPQLLDAMDVLLVQLLRAQAARTGS